MRMLLFMWDYNLFVASDTHFLKGINSDVSMMKLIGIATEGLRHWEPAFPEGLKYA